MTSGNGPEGLWAKKRFNEFINVYSKYFTMKKIYLMWAVAAVAMTGCSKSEVVDQAPDAQTYQQHNQYAVLPVKIAPEHTDRQIQRRQKQRP